MNKEENIYVDTLDSFYWLKICFELWNVNSGRGKKDRYVYFYHVTYLKWKSKNMGRFRERFKKRTMKKNLVNW